MKKQATITHNWGQSNKETKSVVYISQTLASHISCIFLLCPQIPVTSLQLVLSQYKMQTMLTADSRTVQTDLFFAVLDKPRPPIWNTYG